ncbi:MAG: TetR family transcriptional regulator, partial [Nonomuraea sp.]|nr:TetR family transcriptional regulator [Nonomuraea sp.]
RFWHRHLSLLLAEARSDGDTDVLAHTLLAALAADLVTVLSAQYGPQRTRSGILTQTHSLL